MFMRIDKGDDELKAEIDELKLKVSSPTWEEIDTRFNLLFKGRQNDSRLFCYWCGHGYADTKGNRLLLCEDFAAYPVVPGSSICSGWAGC